MSDSQQALEQIARLAREHGLTTNQVLAALDPAPRETKNSHSLSQVLSYLGGIFVFAGLCAFVATLWDDLNSGARVVVTLGPGLSAWILSQIAAERERHRRLAIPLFLIGATLQPIGILVALAEFSEGSDERIGGMITTGIMSLQCLLSFPKKRRTGALFCGIGFGIGFLALALDLIGLDGELNASVVGLSTLCLARSVAKTVHQRMVPLMDLFGASSLLIGWFEIVQNSPLEVSFVAVCCVLVYASTVFRTPALLTVGTVGLLCYIGYFTSEHFADSLGWPVALIGLGIVMMGLSTLAVRIHKRYIRRSND